MKIQIINGINLNLLGVRDPKTYGTKQFEPFLAELRQQYPAVQLDYFQSNSEADIVNKLQEVGFDYDGIIFNPGAFSHYSYGIADMVASVTAPVIEVHMQNPAALDAPAVALGQTQPGRGGRPGAAGLPLRAGKPAESRRIGGRGATLPLHLNGLLTALNFLLR